MTAPIQWRTKKQRYSLQGEVCPKCSNTIFPPRGVCPYCSREHDALYQSVTLYRQRNGDETHRVVFAMPAVPEPLAVGAAGDD